MNKVEEGDKVIIRSWDSIVNEYGARKDFDGMACQIPIPRRFLERMRELCKKATCVTKISWVVGEPYFLEMDTGFMISPEMIIGNPRLGGRVNRDVS